MDITPQTLYAILGCGNTIGLAVLAAITFLRKPGTQAQQQVVKLHEMLSEQTATITNSMREQHHAISTRVTVLEGRVENMPTAAALEEVKGMLREVGARQEGTRDSMAIVRGAVERIENWIRTSERS